MGNKLEPIPGPPVYPIIGNLNEMKRDDSVAALNDLATRYGPIFKIFLPRDPTVIVSNNAFVNELCDESRFQKVVASGNLLYNLRDGIHDGLFTANMDEPNWGIAHRILMPLFGTLSIQSMFDDMHDLAKQLALKWARHGSSEPIMVTSDFTRLTLDTIALCAMGYRFNSYYHDELHPFVEAMADFLMESEHRSQRISVIPEVFYRSANQKYEQDIATLRTTARGVIEARKASRDDKSNDLLSAMLRGVDPKTGQKMSDENIMSNLITFLIAGHETTSGMLSYAIYHLISHPEAYEKTRREVDSVVGKGPVKVEHLKKLPYISAVLREALRISSTIPIISTTPKTDEVIGGKYEVKKGELILMLLGRAHVDPAVYGDDANEFRPERMLDENFERLQKEFPNCWKPFGNGMRACIGRPFAWQEALTVMVMMFQNFDFTMDDPEYELKHKQTLTIKPDEFYMRATLRDGLTPTELEHRLSGSPRTQPQKRPGPSLNEKPNGVSNSSGKPMSVYYGSNTGTCKALAQRMAVDAHSRGFHVDAVEPLDTAVRKLPTDHPVVLIAASFEGEPPDNAASFCSWLKSLEEKSLTNVSYAVFGCGNHDWARTFHKIPKFIDSSAEKYGASRICSMGLSDVADGEPFTDFETWEDEVFWPAMAERYGAEVEVQAPPQMVAEVSTLRVTALKQTVKEALVTAARELSSKEQQPCRKQHIEIQLPKGTRYEPGDYLAVLPFNPREHIDRALRYFKLVQDAHVTLQSEGVTIFPTGTPIPVTDLLGSYVELSQPATKRNILTLATYTSDDITKKSLLKLSDNLATEITDKRVSLLDLLWRFPSISLPLGSFLSMLPPMRVRTYSISSSPLEKPDHASLSYSVLDSPHLADPARRHIGVASSYLSSLAAGDRLQASVHPSHAGFKLPDDLANTPIICIGAGTGIAPFRGFIQHRDALRRRGQKLAPALLFFGCRGPEKDDLYREELDRWQASGVVDTRRAYSRAVMGQAGAGEAKGCKYVQDRMALDGADIVSAWKKGAKVYVCGSREMSESVKKTFIHLVAETVGSDESQGEEEWFQSIRNVRYAVDCFD